MFPPDFWDFYSDFFFFYDLHLLARPSPSFLKPTGLPLSFFIGNLKKIGFPMSTAKNGLGLLIYTLKNDKNLGKKVVFFNVFLLK